MYECWMPSRGLIKHKGIKGIYAVSHDDDINLHWVWFRTVMSYCGLLATCSLHCFLDGPPKTFFFIEKNQLLPISMIDINTYGLLWWNHKITLNLFRKMYLLMNNLVSGGSFLKNDWVSIVTLFHNDNDTSIYAGGKY